MSKHCLAPAQVVYIVQPELMSLTWRKPHYLEMLPSTQLPVLMSIYCVNIYCYYQSNHYVFIHTCALITTVTTSVKYMKNGHIFRQTLET